MSCQENISPLCIRKIAGELRRLTESPLEGVKLVPNESDITDIHALIEGPPGTPYDGGLFRVKLKLGPEFPQAPPKGFFLTKIFHPNVGKNGEICVNTLKRDWREDLGISHILLTIKCLLIAPNPESSLNEEAGRLLLERYDDYAKHARLWTSIHAKASITQANVAKPTDASNPGEPPTSSSTSASTSTPTSAGVSGAKKPAKKKKEDAQGKKKRSLKRL